MREIRLRDITEEDVMKLREAMRTDRVKKRDR